MGIVMTGANSGCVHSYLPSLPSHDEPNTPEVSQNPLKGFGIQYCQTSGNREGEKNPPVPNSI